MDHKKYQKKNPQPTPPAQKSKAPKAEKKIKSAYAWLGFLCASIGFLVYAQTLSYGYALDDYSVILENRSTQLGISQLSYFFKTSLREGYIFISDELYRPLTKSIFALQWSISPNNPLIGHLMNVLLFTITCSIIYKVISTWTKSDMTGLITAVLFAVMPVHTEAVANIKSLDELLGLLLGLLALHSFYRYAHDNKAAGLFSGAFFFLMALFSKESSITFLAIIPLVIYFFTEHRGSKMWIPLGVAAFMAIIFLGIRSNALGENAAFHAPSAADNMLMVAKDKLTQKLTAIYLLGRYLWVTLVGFPLSFDLSYPAVKPVGISDWKFLLSLTTLSTLLIIAILNFKKRSLLSFALFFFFITVSVSSNIFVMIGTHWGERLMYLPGLGICIAVAYLADRSIQPGMELKDRKMLLGLLTAFTLLFGGMTMARNPVWKNNETLYRSGLKSAPESARTNYYMGNFLCKEEQWKNLPEAEKNKVLNEAISYLNTSIRLYRPFADAFNQRGLCYYRLNQNKIAIESFIEGLQINPNEPVIHNNLGTVYFSSGKYPEALKAFQEAVRLKPDYKDAWSNLGSAYGTLQQYNESINAFNRAVSIDPNYAQGWYYLGLTWRYAGDEMKAQQFLAKANALDPNLK